MFTLAQNQYMQVKDTLSKAIEFKRKNKYSEAKNILNSSLNDYPDNKYLKASLADTLYQLGKNEKALTLAKEILVDYPDDSRALIVKGNVFLKKRDYTKALEFFLQAKENNKSEYLLSRLIRTHLQLENFDKALEICQKKLDKEPDNNSFKKLMASIYEKMGETKKATKYYDEYLNNKPEDEFAYKEKLKLKMENKEPKDAVKELKALLKIGDKKNNVFLHHLLAEKLEKLNRYEEALKEYEKSLEIEPGNEFAIKQAGFLLYRMKDYDKSLNYLKETFRNDPDDYYIKSTLIKIFEKTGQINEGIEFFKEIINNNQGYNKLWGTIKKLSKKLGDQKNED